MTLVESSGGVFEIMVDGDLIYSKRATGLFPEDDFILKDIQAKEMQR